MEMLKAIMLATKFMKEGRFSENYLEFCVTHALMLHARALP